MGKNSRHANKWVWLVVFSGKTCSGSGSLKREWLSVLPQKSSKVLLTEVIKGIENGLADYNDGMKVL